jgi:hypothetical protein
VSSQNKIFNSDFQTLWYWKSCPPCRLGLTKFGMDSSVELKAANRHHCVLDPSRELSKEERPLLLHRLSGYLERYHYLAQLYFFWTLCHSEQLWGGHRGPVSSVASFCLVGKTPSDILCMERLYGMPPRDTERHAFGSCTYSWSA